MSHDEKQTLGDPMMLSLFQTETETHGETLTHGLLNLEKDMTNTSEVESLMRAAHSIKGAARIVKIDMAVTLAHAMENLFVSIQEGKLPPSRPLIDKLLTGTDLLRKIGQLASDDTADELMALSSHVDQAVAAFEAPDKEVAPPDTETPAPPGPKVDSAEPVERAVPARPGHIRISAEHINNLMDLAGEVMVQGNRLEHFARTFKAIETQLRHINTVMQHIHRGMNGTHHECREPLGELAEKYAGVQEDLARHLDAFESFAFDFVTISSNIHGEAIASRMRPFSDGVVGFPRMVRDIARSINKQVTFEIIGRETKVDRNILRDLEAPITHLLRNALDHGMETPDQREAAGKDRTGAVSLEASHHAGKLLVVVRDDGRGIDIEKLRLKVVERQLTDAATALKLSEDELLQFMFLPGFSTTTQVTEFSGRGVGLNVVSEMLQTVNGTIEVSSERGLGTEMKMLLPLTLSVMPSLLFELNNEFYAFPLSQTGSCIEITPDMVTSRDGRTFVRHHDAELPIVDGYDALQLPQAGRARGKKVAIQIGSGDRAIALTVDRCVGEQTLVIKPLDPRLDPTPLVSSASIMEDGSTVLSLNIENLLHMADMASSGDRSGREEWLRKDDSRRRVLVVEDSMTVRQMERKIFEENGYGVDTAIDGLDGWNALVNGMYDLIISDVDMPRMNGLEFISKVRHDARFKHIPVIIVSYKDSEKDRQCGMDAGANYYMTKNSFQDNSIIEIANSLLKDATHENRNRQ